MDGVPDGCNTGTNHRVVIREADVCWAAADSLSSKFKALLHTAPFDIDAVEIVEFVREARAWGMPESWMVDQMRQQIATATMTAADDWGPGYPAVPFQPLVPRPARGARRILR